MFDEAIMMYDRALRIEPNNPNVFRNKGMKY